MDIIKNLESMLDKEQDNALIRYSLGNEYLKAKKFTDAIKHLHKAVELDHDYSAAWKLYGKALSENDQVNEAIQAYENGIAVAGKKGDIQAAKEMKVFLKRLKSGE